MRPKQPIAPDLLGEEVQKIGDVLVEINGRLVLTLDAARQALLAASLDKPLPLLVRRDSERLSFVLKPAQPAQ